MFGERIWMTLFFGLLGTVAGYMLADYYKLNCYEFDDMQAEVARDE